VGRFKIAGNVYVLAGGLGSGTISKWIAFQFSLLSIKVSSAILKNYEHGSNALEEK